MHTYLSQIKNNHWLKFSLLCLVLLCYFFYVNYKYDAITGGVSSLLVWSLFVLCTPVADAGFLLDFPLKILFNIKMYISELFVWLVAIIINLIVFNFYPEYYDKTIATKLFYLILSNPFPYWSIILISGLGTFLSIYFGDEIIDTVNDNQSFKGIYRAKHFILIILGFFAIIIFLYYELLEKLNIKDLI